MDQDVVLKQSGFATAIHLVLGRDKVEEKGDLILKSKKEIPLGQVAAILRDKEQVHIVGGGEPISFFNQPGKAAFDYFMAELVRRVVATT